MKRIGKKAFLIGVIGCLIFATPTLANVIQQEKIGRASCRERVFYSV